jgi:glycosyltransferase involved in cell wall biosynthesis
MPMTPKIKVCMIAYAEYGPDARINAYVRSIEQMGGSVDVFVLREGGKRGYEEKGRSRIFYLANKYQGTNTALYISSYLIFFIKAFLKVSYMTIKERYEAAHIHNMPNFIIYAAIIAKVLGVRLLLDVHDLMPVNYMVKFNVSEEHILIKLLIMEQRISAWLASHVLCADHMQKSYLERVCKIPAGKITVIMNLPHEETFRSIIKPRSDTKFRLIYHGTIAKRLGIDIILEAIHLVGDEVPVHLSIYGSGDFLPEVLSLADTLGLDGKVYFSRAFFPAEKIAEMVGGMDLGVIGNRRSLATEKFMMPVKLLEYVYLRIPVVAPRLEIIQSYFDERMLKYYEPENAADLAKSIVELYKCPKERDSFVKNASSFYERRSWKTQAAEYVKLLSGL